MEIDHEIISMVMFFIQVGLLSFTSEIMYTKYWLTACSSLPRKKVWLGKPGLPRSGKKFWKMKNSVQGKSGNYIFSQGNFKKMKGMEKSGNFKFFLKRC